MAGWHLTDAEFLAAPKEFLRSTMRWRSRRNQEDWARAKLTVAVVGAHPVTGTIYLVAHRTRQPPKWSFSLHYLGHRVASLDVNPGRAHGNINAFGARAGVVWGTHWQFGEFTNVREDARELRHSQWLDAFLKETKIHGAYVYRHPPGVKKIQYQLKLKKDDDGSGNTG